ncbi:hypothetical protein PsorP6_008292 [Peronosclerospora sorghi]|uniref:Uncharacterized protein n=1 Tax=Peronosclerospora sorghi TaxID=230839 RepID=A0ACC0W8G8_9STRA|nr:hypothetical protein PsorP6_008292 [Peronosclerospora sorghi]
MADPFQHVPCLGGGTLTSDRKMYQEVPMCKELVSIRIRDTPISMGNGTYDNMCKDSVSWRLATVNT